jgi:hypothetical protein
MGRVCEKRGFGLVLKRISRVCYRMHIASDQFDLASIWCLRGNKDGTLSIQLLSVFKQDSEWRTIVVDEIDNPHRYDCPIEWLPLATSGISSKWRRALISATIERAREQLFNCGDLIDSLDVVGAN